MRGGGTHRVSDKVVQEPRSGYSEQPDPIALEDQPVRDFGVPHRITPEPLGLFHIQPPNQDSEGGDDTQTKRDTPDGPEVVWTEARTPYQTESRKIEENTNIQ